MIPDEEKPVFSKYIDEFLKSLLMVEPSHHFIIYMNDKTGVINDPLGQPTDSAGSDYRLILKFWNGRAGGQSV